MKSLATGLSLADLLPGDGDGPGDPKKKGAPVVNRAYRPIAPQQRADWNKYVDYLEQQGAAGKEDMDKIGPDGKYPWQKHFADFKAKNPDLSFDESWIPDFQADFYNTNEAVKQRTPGKHLSANPSKFDGVVGSKTSTQRYPGAEYNSFHNGVQVEHKELGLLDANMRPTGAGAAPSVPGAQRGGKRRRPNYGDSGATEASDGTTVWEDEIPAYEAALQARKKSQ